MKFAANDIFAIICPQESESSKKFVKFINFRILLLINNNNIIIIINNNIIIIIDNNIIIIIINI